MKAMISNITFVSEANITQMAVVNVALQLLEHANAECTELFQDKQLDKNTRNVVYSKYKILSANSSSEKKRTHKSHREQSRAFHRDVHI